MDVADSSPNRGGPVKTRIARKTVAKENLIWRSRSYRLGIEKKIRRRELANRVESSCFEIGPVRSLQRLAMSDLTGFTLPGNPVCSLHINLRKPQRRVKGLFAFSQERKSRDFSFRPTALSNEVEIPGQTRSFPFRSPLVGVARSFLNQLGDGFGILDPKIHIPLRKGELNVVFVKRIPDLEKDIAANVPDSIVGILDPESQLKVY